MPKFREFDPFNPKPINAPSVLPAVLKAIQVVGVVLVGLFLVDTYSRVTDGVNAPTGAKRAASMHTTVVPTEEVDKSPLWSVTPVEHQ